MPELFEAIPGTIFLFLPVVVFIYYGVPWTTILALVAALAIPVGWLCFNFEGFYLTWKGRYEDTPPYNHIRERIIIDEDSGKFVVNLEKVLPEEYEIRKVVCSDKREYDDLFDPFKRTTELWYFKPIFGVPFRKKQPEIYKERYKGEMKPFYVENVEDMTFFSNPALANYIREQTRYWHILRASFYGLLWGATFASGLLLVILSNFLCFSITSSLILSDFFCFCLYAMTIMFGLFLKVLGLILCAIPIIVLPWTTYEYSKLRRKESLAHEYLLIKLKME